MSFPEKKTPTILLPSMGAGWMPDHDVLKDALEAKGAYVISKDISGGNINQLPVPWKDIDVVNLGDMRSCLTSFPEYQGILQTLASIKKEENKNLVSTPRMRCIDWIASKSTYLPYLQDKGIETIPTHVLNRHSESKRPSSIAPDNVDGAIESFKTYVDANVHQRTFVLKPSISSLAVGLVFIHRLDGDAVLLEYPHANSSSTIVNFKNLDELCEKFLYGRLTSNSFGDAFLLQPYIENLETSAVFVNGRPHYVERQQGEKSRIAHGNFGGTDTVIQNPDSKLVAFVQRVIDALPDGSYGSPPVQHSSFLRIDVMKISDGEYILGEIEGAGATRLWLNEAGRAGDYADMLISMADNPEFVPNRLSTYTGIDDFMLAHRVDMRL